MGKYRDSVTNVAPTLDRERGVFIVGGVHYPAELKESKDGKSDKWVSKPGTCPIRLDETELYQIRANDIITLDEAGVIRLAMILDCGEVAPNMQNMNTDVHRFFIKDEQKESVAASKNFDLQYDAMTLVRQMSLSDQRLFAYYGGQSAGDMSQEQIDGWIKIQASSNPKMIIDALRTKLWKVDAFLNKLVQYRILKSVSGAYKFGEDIIGIDKEAALVFLQNPANESLISQFNDKVRRIEGNSMESKEIAPVKQAPKVVAVEVEEAITEEEVELEDEGEELEDDSDEVPVTPTKRGRKPGVKNQVK